MGAYLASSSKRMTKGLGALQGAAPSSEEEARQYREQIVRQIKLNAIGLMASHRTTVTARRADMYAEKKPSSDMQPLRDAAFNMARLDSTKEKLERFESKLRVVESRALLRRGSLADNLDDLALNSNQIMSSDDRQALIDRYETTRARNDPDFM